MRSKASTQLRPRKNKHVRGKLPSMIKPIHLFNYWTEPVHDVASLIFRVFRGCDEKFRPFRRQGQLAVWPKIWTRSLTSRSIILYIVVVVVVVVRNCVETSTLMAGQINQSYENFYIVSINPYSFSRALGRALNFDDVRKNRNIVFGWGRST